MMKRKTLKSRILKRNMATSLEPVTQEYTELLGKVFSQLRAWAKSENELSALLNQGMTSIYIACKVAEMTDGIFSFFQSDRQLHLIANVRSFSRLRLDRGDGSTVIDLGTEAGESLMITDIAKRPEDIFNLFTAASSSIH